MPTATVFIKCRRLFMSSIKREIRYLHVVVVQWRQRNVQKSVTQVQTVDVLFIQPRDYKGDREGIPHIHPIP